MIYAGTTTRQNLEESLLQVFDETKPANGPHDIPLRPDGTSWYIELRMKAIHALLHNEAIPDLQWEWARCVHLSHLSQYIKDQRQYAYEAAGTPVESVFSLETIESLWSSTCADIAAIIGLGLQWPVTPGMPEQLRLDEPGERRNRYLKTPRFPSDAPEWTISALVGNYGDGHAVLAEGPVSVSEHASACHHRS